MSQSNPLTITQVKSEPYEVDGRWWIDVVVQYRGSESNTHLMCFSLEDAAKVKPGVQLPI